MVIKQIYFSLLAFGKTTAAALTVLFTLGLIALSTPVYAESVTASLDKNVVTENDVVQLTIRADFTDTGTGPDLTPLKKDFDIISQSQSSQFSFNLGTNTAMSYWVISLMPKSVGTFTIPPIKIGQHASEPIKLIVKTSPQLLDENGNAPVMFKVTASNDTPYLQQQVIVTMQLYTSVSLGNANLSTPSNPDLVFEQLTDDQTQFQMINGTRYQVLTRRYLAFPQKSGKLTIEPQTLKAMMDTRNGRRIIRLQSQPIDLDVLPIPPSYSNDNWLPSHDVSIKTDLSKPNDAPRVGNTLIWTINIDAKGALPEQIPELNFNSTKAYKLYPQPAKFSSDKSSDGIIGHKTIKVEVVPTTAGDLKLPDVSVTYWDTQSRTEKTVTTSTPSINIAPLPQSSDKQSTKDKSATVDNKSTLGKPLPPQPASTAPISLTKHDEGKQIANNQKSVSSDPKSLQPILATEDSSLSIRQYVIIGLSILTATLLLVWYVLLIKKRKPKDEEASVPTLQDFAPLSSSDEKSAFKSLIECCRQDDLSQLRSHLLEWARHRWGDSEIRSVEDIKRLAGSVTLTQLLMEAELMLYSQQSNHQWQGAPLAEALEEYQTGQPKESQSSQLKTLYPNF